MGQEDDNQGPRLRDLTRDGALNEVIDREMAEIAGQRDAYREAAIERELELRRRAEVEGDIAAEADRRSGRPHLRAVD